MAGAGAMTVLEPLRNPTNLLAVVHLLHHLPEATPERWKVVRDFVTHRVGTGAQLATDAQWLGIVVRHSRARHPRTRAVCF